MDTRSSITPSFGSLKLKNLNLSKGESEKKLVADLQKAPFIKTIFQGEYIMESLMPMPDSYLNVNFNSLRSSIDSTSCALSYYYETPFITAHNPQFEDQIGTYLEGKGYKLDRLG